MFYFLKFLYLNLMKFLNFMYFKLKFSDYLYYEKLSDNAIIPTKAYKEAAGYDLYSAYDYYIPPKGKKLVVTDIRIKVPKGSYGRIAPKSGLAIKHFIDVGGGVIDRDYTGNITIIVFNFDIYPFYVKKGNMIAQLIIERIYYPCLKEFKFNNSLLCKDNCRGSRSFGSTDKTD